MVQSAEHQLRRRALGRLVAAREVFPRHGRLRSSADVARSSNSVVGTFVGSDLAKSTVADLVEKPSRLGVLRPADIACRSVALRVPSPILAPNLVSLRICTATHRLCRPSWATSIAGINKCVDLQDFESGEGPARPSATTLASTPRASRTTTRRRSALRVATGCRYVRSSASAREICPCRPKIRRPCADLGSSARLMTYQKDKTRVKFSNRSNSRS